MRLIRHEDWYAGRMALVPDRWAKDFARIFREKAKGEPFNVASNTWLNRATEKLEALRIPLTASDGDICAMADRCASECMSMSAIAMSNLTSIRESMGRYVVRWGLVAPDGEDMTDRAAVMRMTDPLWWRRGLRVIHARGLESEAIARGYVHRRADIYCSNETLKRRTQQRRRNADTLASIVATNELGDEFTLAELAEKSVANPAIRRGELMTRIAGFEAVSLGLEHVGEFTTVTCPSRMHSRLSKSGAENPTYDGTTPKQAHQYLGKVWQRVRAALQRKGVKVYGFRIAEPHHDGCPHWHFLFFMAPESVKDYRATMSRYFLADSPDERGAQQNRVKFVAIDRKRGTAAGYIAKYVAKNIDGYGIESDLFGTPALEASARVEAWASTWGITQFRQIGGPPVGVWRELRRMESGAGGIVEAQAAANAGNWRRYVEVMGGPIVKRKDLPLRVAHGVKFDVVNVARWVGRWVSESGLVGAAGRYGEKGMKIVLGVRCMVSGAVAASRRFVWELVNKQGKNKGQAVKTAPWSPVNNCTRGGNESRRKEAIFGDGVRTKAERIETQPHERPGIDVEFGLCAGGYRDPGRYDLSAHAEGV
ncbi:MAG: hypothetical protein RugAbin2_02419 [Rugosibacter sp.]|nr:hypothetical protein [Rugosibacter sp.]